MNRTIGVAIASFNGEKYISEQINSILNQKTKVDKIVINDDKSTDKTVRIINKLIKKGYPIVLHQNEENLGYSRNFLECIKKCDTDYIFICDQDDWWQENKVEEMENFINNNRDSLCWMHDCSLTNENLEIKVKSKINNIQRQFMNRNCFVMGSCMVLSKKAKNYIYPYPTNMSKYGHDNWIAFVMQGINKLKVTSKSLLLYRRHGNNTSIDDVNSLSFSNRYVILLKKLIKKISSLKKTSYKKVALRNRDLEWSRLLKRNTEKFNLKIKKEFQIKTFKTASKISENNFLGRIILIRKLINLGYYKYRSNLFSALDDLFFS